MGFGLCRVRIAEAMVPVPAAYPGPQTGSIDKKLVTQATEIVKDAKKGPVF